MINWRKHPFPKLQADVPTDFFLTAYFQNSFLLSLVQGLGGGDTIDRKCVLTSHLWGLKTKSIDPCPLNSLLLNSGYIKSQKLVTRG